MWQPTQLLPPLVGYALVFNVPSCRMRDGRRLQFQAGAFDHFLATDPHKIYATMHHEGRDIMFAAWERGSLLIDSDSHGLFVVALPRNDEHGRIVASLVDGGHVREMSAGTRFSDHHVVRRGGTDIVRIAWLAEVSAVDQGAMPKTCLHVAHDGAEVPQTVEELLAEDCRLRDLNLRHAKARTLPEWKFEKTAARAQLLQRIQTHNELAAVG
jgi:HK97 family phage prohead protease